MLRVITLKLGALGKPLVGSHCGQLAEQSGIVDRHKIHRNGRVVVGPQSHVQCDPVDPYPGAKKRTACDHNRDQQNGNPLSIFELFRGHDCPKKVLSCIWPMLL
ncbi:hypothetical protein F2S73_16290 [Pseudomonas syringae pv. actinidiae]|nr:hypothetical protein [Pseudomonas syringae pv. actinidiae]